MTNDNEPIRGGPKTDAEWEATVKRWWEKSRQMERGWCGTADLMPIFNAERVALCVSCGEPFGGEPRTYTSSGVAHSICTIQVAST